MKQTNRAFTPFSFLTNTYLALLFSFFLLWPGTQGYGAIQEAKATCFYWLSSGYLVLMLLSALERLLIGTLKTEQLRFVFRHFSWPQHLVLLYWLLTSLSTVLSPYRQEALLGMSRCEGLLTISLYCATFLCISIFAKPDRWLGWILAGSMTAYDIICLLQLTRHNPFGLFPDGVDYYAANKQFTGIFLGTTGNAGLTAAILTLTLPLLIGLIHHDKSRLRCLAILPTFLNIIILFWSKIEAGLLGTALGLLLALPILLGPGKRQKIAWCLVALVFLCGIVTVLICPTESGTLYELNQLLHGNWNPRFGNGRIHIWKEVLTLVPNNLWFGTGPDTMQAFHVPGLTWYHAPSGTTVPLMIDIAHNEYLNILFHQGILALAAYLGALLLSALKWLRTCNPAVAVLGASVLCYCIQAFFSYSMSASAALFWAVWALLVNRIQRTEEHI